MSTTESLNSFVALAPVRVVAVSNQTVTYFNGAINNGVGATCTYTTGTLTIDSVVVNLNDFVLLSGQTAGYENGIYQCTQQGATGVTAILTRRGDFQSMEQMQTGAFVPVSAGTVYGGAVFTVIEPLPAAIGVPVVSGANDINFATITAAASSLYLAIANNLSDVNSASTSATNLGLGTANTPSFAGVISTGFLSTTVNSKTASTTHTQIGATLLTAQITSLTVSNADDTIVLPAVATVGIGGWLVIINNSAETGKMYGHSAETIDGTAGSSGSVSLTASVTTILYAVAAGTWLTGNVS